MRSAPYFAIKHEPYRGDDIYIYIAHLYRLYRNNTFQCTHAFICTFVHTDPSCIQPCFLQIYGPVEIVAYQGSPCTGMFTLDQGCICKWTNKYTGSADPNLARWQYAEKGAQFGTDSLLLYLDPFKRNAETTHNCVWFQSFQTLTFCEYYWRMHMHRCPLTQNHAMAEIYTGDFIFLSADDFARILQRYPKVS